MPDQVAAHVVALEAGAGKHPIDVRRSMQPPADRIAGQPAPCVEHPSGDAVPPGLAREDEPDRPPRSFRCALDQRWHVGVAAHDLVEGDDVGRLDLRRERHEVPHSTREALAEAAALGFLVRNRHVRLSGVD